MSSAAEKVLKYTLNIPVYLLVRFVPKRHDLWVFGAWFGGRYADSSKYLFQHVNRQRPEIRAIWLTTSEEVLLKVRSQGYEAYPTYSLKGYYYSAIAGVGFICCAFEDINFFARPSRIVNLWHGIALKKVVYDDRYSKLQRPGALTVLRNVVFPFAREDFSRTIAIAASETEAANLASAFRIDRRQICVTGLPRNDVFGPTDRQPTRRVKKIIYMPTHRNEGAGDVSSFLEQHLERLNAFMQQRDMCLCIKHHFYHAGSPPAGYSHVRYLLDRETEGDIYSVIDEFDLLITDYSSIYFDFLLSDRPVIFLPFDLEAYVSGDRELYFPYDEVTPGPKCRDIESLLEWIGRFAEDPGLYAEQRAQVRARFHRYTDGRSCERVFAVSQRYARGGLGQALLSMDTAAGVPARGGEHPDRH